MADNGMMDGNSLLYQAVMMMVLCMIFLAVWSRCGKRSILLEDLSVPLIDATPEHRIDAATREAEAGFRKCSACSFENFTRFKYCTICGEKLPFVEADETPSPSPSPSAVGGTPRGPSARHLRARKRKLWTRKLDADNLLFWDKKPSGEELSSVSEIPAVTVEFKEHKKKDPQDGVEAIEDALLHEISNRDMVLTDAFQADAARFPTGYAFTPDSDRRKEIVRLATLDFPSKYAHFVVTTASQVVPAEVEFLKLSVHRDFVLEESVDHLCCIQEKHIKSVMRINFLDESGVDAGGVHREWILLLNEVLADSQLNLFPCRNRTDHSHYFNPNSLQEVGVDHLKYYYATGRLIGRVLLEGSLWGFHLAVPLLKIILGHPVSFSDLEYLDPEVYKNLRWLVENDGVESLSLNFSVCEITSDGQTTVVDLIPNGREIAVTDENKVQFIVRKFRYHVFESVSSQLYALLKGIYEVIPQELLMLYDVEELDYLLCGTDEIDVEDWKAHTNHAMNLNGTRVMEWFWDEVASMPNEYRRRLLLFATGSSRVPLSGFRGLTSYDGRLCPFTLKGVSSSTDKYITSHACFNRLDLPLYRSRSELKTVLYAILEGDCEHPTTDGVVAPAVPPPPPPPPHLTRAGVSAFTLLLPSADACAWRCVHRISSESSGADQWRRVAQTSGHARASASRFCARRISREFAADLKATYVIVLVENSGRKSLTVHTVNNRPPAMSPEEGMFVGLIVFFVLANCACHLQLRRDKREWAELHAPLNADSADHRLDAALREAQAGSTLCSGCGFENFHRAIFCSICGQIIGALSKRQKKKMGKEVVLGNVRRQLRARSRKEWTRKVDVDGNLYWYRDSTPLAGPMYPGAVVCFQQQSPDALNIMSCTDGAVTLDTVTTGIARAHAKHTITMEDPSTTDPTAFFSTTSLDQDGERKHELRQLVEHSQRDFPSKLAEFVTHALSLFIDAEDMVSVFHINRATLLSDSFDSLAKLTPTQARAAIRIDFVDEQGIDAGGVYREWFLVLNEEIIAPEAGVFVCVDKQDQTFYLNPRSREVLGENHLAHFLAVGRLLGRALLEGNVTGFHLALPLLKIILGLPVSFSDLEYFDPESFKSLQWLLDNDDVDELGLDFTVSERLADGLVRTVELMPRGAEVDVTDANKCEYVDRKLRYLLVDSVPAQLFAFLKGLYEVVPPEMLMLFDAEELDYVLSGSDEIDVEDWERNTKYSADLWSHPTRQWFWELVREMPNEYRRRLLQFATGSSRAPLSGFSALTSYDGRLCPFTLVGMPLLDEGFVRSHACFNRLDVPRHVNKGHLKKGLYALLETESYGFTTA